MTQHVAADRSSPEDRSARARIGAAGKLLRESKSGVPDGFAGLMFARTAPEDLVRYDAAEIATLTREAWTFFGTRKPGAPKIRFASPDASWGERLKTISVIEMVNDDMPFLVDSVMGELNERGLDVRLVAHPIIAAERDKGGKLKSEPHEAKGGNGRPRESFIHIHVERVADDARRAEIVQSLEQVLAQVRVAVQDWRLMIARVEGVIKELKSNPPPVPVDDIAEAIQFLEWLAADNFTLLGVRDHAFTGKSRELAPVKDTALGILRADNVPVFTRGGQAVTVSPQLRAFFDEPKTLIVMKANVRSRVHRRVYLDYVGVKRFDGDGNAVGEFRILGLFTSTAYTRSVRSIPYLRRKVDATLRRAGFDPNTHSGKALVNVLEGYPRDELFQIDEDTLYEFTQAILPLEERPRVRVLARRDRFDRFVSVLVFAPRERYDSRVRVRIGAYLAEAYKGHVSAFYPSLPEGGVARVHFIIGRSGGETPDPDRATLEQAVGAIVRTWSDALGARLAETHEPGRARALFDRYGNAFSEGYREAYPPDDAIEDIHVIEGLTADRPLGVEFYPRSEDGKPCVGLKVWSYGKPIPLSERVPVLENMGFRVVDERTFEVGGEPGAWLHDMALERADGQPAGLEPIKAALESCFIVVMRGLAESDGYNALVITAGLQWRDVALVRTISRFLRQIGVPYSQGYMWATLRKHAALAAKVVELFHARFDPRPSTRSFRGARHSALDTRVNALTASEPGIQKQVRSPPLDSGPGPSGRPGMTGGEAQRSQHEQEIAAQIEEGLAAVAALDEDRIIRRFVNAVQSAIRTNYYQLGRDGRPKHEIAIKFGSRRLDGVPRPAPLYEIFVYSPRVEGVHLRFGKVARGGIRWSDRPQDFRTEILGLVKAQQVKNAVIVPVGAKGGFVPKRLVQGMSRQAAQEAGIAAYRLFISSLLDLTDNLGPQGVVPPKDVVRHDGDDPYLVVAADKGTASFSDIANAISVEYGFWLGDAFASGGSAGYDHKKMGITARGGWECVKRHFRELGMDIQSQDFTASGIGDMSGDVFGNGMLLSKHMRLQAAFNHQHIFLDPSPDAASSFAERERLFNLPRSTWDDYDRKKISRGGGVYSRSVKSISLSPAAQSMLGLQAAAATPTEIIRAILRMPVDLLWNGGIGTYVKASDESHNDVGDRANDAVRINGAELRAKVVGEGGNLGFSQRGRVEYALAGGRINTDFIDNSAGVNTSDVEVNIKILLNPLMQAGKLTQKDRDKLLARMTDEVAALVLRNNYLQGQAISTLEMQSAARLPEFQHLIRSLERTGDLNRSLEFLPSDEELNERRKRGIGLTRPELSVVLAYSKIWLSNHLLASDVPEDPYLSNELGRYFPAPVQERFPRAIPRHRLKREIVTTATTNSLINRMGPTFVARTQEETGADAADIARAYTAAREIFDMRKLWARIESLDNRVTASLQYGMMYQTSRLLRHVTYWLLAHRRRELHIDKAVAEFRRGVRELEAEIGHVLVGADRDRYEQVRKQHSDAGTPAELASRIACLDANNAALDIIELAKAHDTRVVETARIYFEVGGRTGLDWMRQQVEQLVVDGPWQAVARTGLRDNALRIHRRLAERVLRLQPPRKERGNAQARVTAWVESLGDELAHWQRTLADMRAAGAADFATLTVGVETVRKLAD